MNAFEEVGEEVFKLPPVRPGRPLAFTLEFLDFFLEQAVSSLPRSSTT